MQIVNFFSIVRMTDKLLQKFTQNLLDIIKFLEVSQELSLRELTIYLQSFLVENKAKWMEKIFVLIYQTSFKYDSLLELQKLCTDIITNEPERIFESIDFISISEK